MVNRDKHFQRCHLRVEGRLMADSSFRQDLQGFAIELRKLAYTMPAGHEDRLIHLSERMAAYSRQSPEVRRRRA